jgi:hypothetical protein
VRKILDKGLCHAPFGANFNITGSTGQAKKTTGKPTNPRAFPSVKATTIEKISWLFVWFVVKKTRITSIGEPKSEWMPETAGYCKTFVHFSVPEELATIASRKRISAIPSAVEG